MCLFFSAQHINDIKHLYLLILLCLFWGHAKAEQSFQLNDFKSTSWFLLNQGEPSVDNKTRLAALHISHGNTQTGSEINEKAGLLVNPAIHSLAASGLSPTSILALLYKPADHAEKQPHHEVAVCVSSAPVVKKRVWAVSDNLPYPLDCEPLTAADNRHACKVRLDLNREHQVLAISGARFDSDCTQQLLLKTLSESPITKMAVAHYSRITERQASSDQDNRKIQQELTGQFNPAGLPFPPGERREKLLLSGGGGGDGDGWDDFHDQGRRSPPWVSMQLHKLHVILPGVPLPSLFYDADASEDQNQESPAGWSVDGQQNRVTVHFEENGVAHRMELDLDDWELLVQHGIARLPDLLYRVMVNMLRYQGQQKQLLKELDDSLAQNNEQSASLVAGIIDDLTALPPDHLLLATSLADLLVPAYESHLRQEAGWTLQKEHPANTQWFYFNTLKILAGLLSQRSAAEQALNALWNSEGKRLILSPLGALEPDRVTTLLSDQISQIAHNILDYFKAPFRQASGGEINHQSSGAGAGQAPSAKSPSGHSEPGSGGGFQTPGGGQNGEDKKGDDGGEGRKEGSGQNSGMMTKRLTCSECHRELTEEDIKRLSSPGRKQNFDKPLCQTCTNKKRSSTSDSTSLTSFFSYDAAMANKDSNNDNVDTHTPGCSLIPFLFRGQNRVTREQLKVILKTHFLQNLKSADAENLAESALKKILRVGLPLVKKIPVAIPTETGVATETDIIKWFVNSAGARKLMAKAATNNRFKSVIEHLLDKGMNVNFRYHGRTPLHIALQRLKNARDIAFLLIDSGADLNAGLVEFDRDNLKILQNTPLTLIARKSDAELFGKMLESGMSLKDNLYQPLCLISSNGDLESFKLLINQLTKTCNSKKSLSNSPGCVFLELCSNVIASPCDSPDFIRAAAEVFDIDFREKKLTPRLTERSHVGGFFPWELTIQAARHCKHQILEFLLGYDYFKDNINKCFHSGTALDYAMKNGCRECKRLIVNNKGATRKQIVQAVRKLAQTGKTTIPETSTDPALIAAAALIGYALGGGNGRDYDYALGGADWGPSLWFSGGFSGGCDGGGFSGGFDGGGCDGGGFSGGYDGGGCDGGGFSGGFGGGCDGGGCGGM